MTIPLPVTDRDLRHLHSEVERLNEVLHYKIEMGKPGHSIDATRRELSTARVRLSEALDQLKRAAA